MDDEKNNYSVGDAAPEDTGAEEAYRSLEAEQSSAQVQPTKVSPAAAHYVQDGATPSYQISQQPQSQPGTYQPNHYQVQTPQTQQVPSQQVPYQQPYQYQQQGQQAYQQGQQSYQQGCGYQAPAQTHQPVRQPPIPQAQVPQYVEPTHKHSYVGLKAALFGLLGGAVGALAVVLALRGAGIIGSPRVITVSDNGSAGQTISISPSNQDITVSQAVAAKALPKGVLCEIELIAEA